MWADLAGRALAVWVILATAVTIAAIIDRIRRHR